MTKKVIKQRRLIKDSFLKRMVASSLSPFLVLVVATGLFFLIDILAAIALAVIGLSPKDPSHETLISFSYVLMKCIFTLLSLGLILRLIGHRWQKFGFSWPGIRKMLWFLPATMVYFSLSLGLTLLINLLFVDFKSAEQQNVGFQSVLGGYNLVLAGLTLIILAPLAEELLFRGWLFRGLRRQLPFWLSALVVSGLFGLAHGQWNVGLDTFALSLLLCWLVEKTNSLYPAIALHMTKNTIAFTLLYLLPGGK